MRTIMLLLLVIGTMQLNAQLVKMTDETSEVKFKTRHLAAPLEGTFKGVAGSAIFNPNDLAHSYLKFSFAVATIQSNDPVLGINFIQPDCFYPAKYPTIELFSSQITRLKEANQYLFTGLLKVKGVSKAITFPMTVTANAGGNDFLFAFAFKKKDFNVKCGTAKDFKILVRTYGKQS